MFLSLRTCCFSLLLVFLTNPTHISTPHSNVSTICLSSALHYSSLGFYTKLCCSFVILHRDYLLEKGFLHSTELLTHST